MKKLLLLVLIVLVAAVALFFVNPRLLMPSVWRAYYFRLTSPILERRSETYTNYGIYPVGTSPDQKYGAVVGFQQTVKPVKKFFCTGEGGDPIFGLGYVPFPCIEHKILNTKAVFSLIRLDPISIEKIIDFPLNSFTDSVLALGIDKNGSEYKLAPFPDLEASPGDLRLESVFIASEWREDGLFLQITTDMPHYFYSAKPTDTFSISEISKEQWELLRNNDSSFSWGLPNITSQTHSEYRNTHFGKVKYIEYKWSLKNNNGASEFNFDQIFSTRN